MIEQKEFYRKLDLLLNNKNGVHPGIEFLLRIAADLGKSFGNDFHIGRGCIYEKNCIEYCLISPLLTPGNLEIKTKLDINSNVVQSIINHETVIFNNNGFDLDTKGNHKKNYSISSAIRVHNHEHDWILFFELEKGWIREEIEFCLIAVRTVLNYRLLSESIKNEYEQTLQVQTSLLPTSSPQIPGYQIAGKSQQAGLRGDNIFDCYRYNDEEFGFCISDTSGNKISAELLAREAIIELHMELKNSMSMVPYAEKLNRVIFHSVYSTKFISLFYTKMESNGTLFYVNAGNPSPIMVYRNEVTELESTGLVFGSAQEIELRRSYIDIFPGSVLVLFSDGIVERQNTVGEEFGLVLLKDVIIKHKDLDAEEILNAIFLTANKFSDKRKCNDDAAVVVVKRIDSSAPRN